MDMERKEKRRRIQIVNFWLSLILAVTLLYISRSFYQPHFVGGIFIFFIIWFLVVTLLKLIAGAIFRENLFIASRYKCRACGEAQADGEWEKAMQAKAIAMGSTGFYIFLEKLLALNADRWTLWIIGILYLQQKTGKGWQFINVLNESN